MSTSVPPRDSGTPNQAAGSPGGPTILADEQTLKRAFDADFATNLESARSQLGEAGTLAPKVVEAAFVQVWNRRNTVRTADELKVAIADEIRHGAARALSRRASGHRFGALGGGTHADAHAASQTDAAEVWLRIERCLHQESHSAEAHAAAATAGRHEAAAHMKAVAKRPSWIMPVVIGVVGIAGTVAAMMYLTRLGEDDAVFSAVSAPGLTPIASSSGQIGSTTLGDGSKVRMGPETKIMVPDGFATKMRAVKVEGTAAFEVAPDPKLPFKVVVKRTQVIATGTSFIVSAFPSDSGVRIWVREGSVTVKADGKTTTVPANQGLVVDRGETRAPTAEEKAEAFGWIDGRITVQGKQLRTVVEALTRWFNYDVKVPDLPLLDRNASIDVPLDSSRLAITQVEQSANVKFAYEGESKVFRDATPKDAKAKDAKQKK